MRNLESRSVSGAAKTGTRFTLSFVASVLLAGSIPAFAAQEEDVEPAVASTVAPVEAPAEVEAQAPVEEVTEVDRILRISRVIELDEERLKELREEMVEREDILSTMGALVRKTEDDLIEAQRELEQIDPAAGRAVRVELEGRIGRLETDLDLFKTQTEFEFENVRAHRDAIAALEKKLVRERRTLDYLRTGGGLPDEQPKGEPPAPGESASAASGRVPIPGMPALPTAEQPGPTTTVTAPETAALIAARREVARKHQEVREAEYLLVEFVKRQESLDLQIENERKLISTVEGSRANLERAADIYESELERAGGEGVDASLVAELERRMGQVRSYLEATILEIEKRTSYVASLEERRKKLALEEETLSRAVEEARRAEEASVRAMAWLESPLHPVNVTRWAVHRGPRILLVLVTVIVLLLLVRLSMRRMARLAVRKGQGRRSSTPTNRADTLAFSFKSAATMLIVIGGVLLILQEAGVDVKTVLGGAAIFGVAVAFGAQNLMKDYFTGFMILLEDQYELGDLVTIDNVTGRVEKVNMRTTVLRDLEGRVHFIPNGNVRSVTNRSYEWGRAVLEVPVSFQENVDRVMAVLLDVAQELRDDPDFEGWVTDDPTMLGVDKFTEAGTIIKFMVQTRPDKIFPTRRELLRRVKNRFDEEGIEISVPYRKLLGSLARE